MDVNALEYLMLVYGALDALKADDVDEVSGSADALRRVSAEHPLVAALDAKARRSAVIADLLHRSVAREIILDAVSS
jgi:hypothetical protein